MDEPPIHDGRFARIERMVTSAGLARLQRARVTIIGLGAVGSYATEALARAGIGHLRLVDFDEVRLSNINRQLFALESTVGRKKTHVARERVLQINPRCRVEIMDVFVHTDTVDAVLDGGADVVIDAIDALTPKVELLAALRGRNMRMVSSMGAALRTDPSQIRVGTIEEVHHDPLAAKVRKALRKRGIPVDIRCVYSTESTDHLPPAATEPGPSTSSEDTYDRGRRRKTLGSLPTLTGIFGLTAANEVLRMILK
jgi:tRNA threonylcarbamoyladenosine dehydratase